MSVKIRLQRKGRRKQPYYHIVVADARAPRDGRFIEKIGSYNPMTSPATIEIDSDRALDWLFKGAQPTDTARAILRFKGVLYRKHLQRGVTKGALSQEKADEMYESFMQAKNERVAKRFEETEQARLDRMAEISGTAPAREVVEEVEEAAEATADNAEAAAETATEAAGAATETVTDTVEEAAESVAEKAEEVTEAAAEKAEEAVEAVEETAENVAEAVEEKVEEVKEAASAAVAEATETAEEVTEEVKEAVSSDEEE